jgi:hypothetical protein
MIRIRWAEGVWALLVLLAAVIGGPALQFEDGGWGWLTGIFLIPAAVTAMLVDLLAPDRNRRTA